MVCSFTDIYYNQLIGHYIATLHLMCVYVCVYGDTYKTTYIDE